MRSLVVTKRKVKLKCGAMLEDKHCLKFGGVIITFRNTNYYDLLGKTIESKCKLKYQNT